MLSYRKNLDAKTLKDNVDLRDIVASAWGEGRRSGSAMLYQSRWRSDDHTPSFAVYADGYKDFGTNDCGDVYHFIQQEYNLNFTDAIDWLNGWTGQAVRAHGGATLPTTTAQHEPPPAEWQTAARAVIAECEQTLWDEKWVLQYHYQRGLNDETIRKFHLGYNPTWRQIPYRDPSTNRLIQLPPGIVIPWMVDGVLWGVRVRCRVGNLAAALGIPDDRFSTRDEPLPKYMNLKGGKQSGALFNADALTSDCPVLLVEGEFDAMLAQQHIGDVVSVVTLGSASNNLSRRWQDRLRQSPVILSLLDQDDAGQQASQRLSALFGTQHHTLHLPAGKDVTDYVVEHGGDLRSVLAPSPIKREGLTTDNTPIPSWWGQEEGGDITPAWFTSGVPDSWRQAALNYLDTGAAMLLERMNQLLITGEIQPDAITIPALLDACQSHGWNIGESTLRRGIAALSGVFLSELQIDNPQQKTVCKVERNGAGRRSKVYETCSLETARRALLAYAKPRIWEKFHPVQGEHVMLAQATPSMIADAGVSTQQAGQVAQQLNTVYTEAFAQQNNREQFTRIRVERACDELEASLDDETTTPLPVDAAYRNHAEYRAVFLRALVEAEPDASRSRREIADCVGASERGVSAVLQRAGLENVEQFADVAVKHGGSLAQFVRNQAARVKGYPLVLVISGGKRERTIRYDADTASDAVKHALAQGLTVTLRFQVASKQRVITEAAAPLPLPEPVQKTHRRDMAHRVRTERTKPMKPFFGRRHNPQWIMAQFRLALVMLGWRLDVQGRMIQRDTGEVLPDYVTPLEIIEYLLGQRVTTGDRLLDLGRELGGVIQPVINRRE